MTLTVDDAHRMEECIAGGGVAVFPSDTVYGVGCEPDNQTAVERLYALKGRPAARPAAVMFFSLHMALRALPELGRRERAALCTLLPGPLTLLLPNRARRFKPACAADLDTLGVRVPLLPRSAAVLGAVEVPVMQSSANISGESEVRRFADIPTALREGADLALDGGELPGTASTVLDLRAFEERQEWRIARAGPVSAEALEQALGDLHP
jgi:L-threonylcarbamoyladenylate synthase